MRGRRCSPLNSISLNLQDSVASDTPSVTYNNFSVTYIPEPPFLLLLVGAAALAVLRPSGSTLQQD